MLAKPVLLGLGTLNLLIFFLFGVALLIAIGVPIAFSFGVATLLYFVFATRLPLSVIVGRMNEGMSSVILLTIPLFIFLGLLLKSPGSLDVWWISWPCCSAISAAASVMCS